MQDKKIPLYARIPIGELSKKQAVKAVIKLFHDNNKNFFATNQWIIDTLASQGVKISSRSVDRSISELSDCFEIEYYQKPRGGRVRIIKYKQPAVDYENLEPANGEKPNITADTSAHKEWSAEIRKMVNKLAHNVQENNSFVKLKKGDGDKWAKELDKMNRLDDIELSNIDWLIDYVNNDTFWSKIIRSASGLRKNAASILGQALAREDQAKERQQKIKERNLRNG